MNGCNYKALSFEFWFNIIFSLCQKGICLWYKILFLNHTFEMGWLWFFFKYLMFQSFLWDKLWFVLKYFHGCTINVFYTKKKNHKLQWNLPHNFFLTWAKLSNEHISFVSSSSRTQELSTKSCCNGIAWQPSRQLVTRIHLLAWYNMVIVIPIYLKEKTLNFWFFSFFP
jgi:hypothetical protein